MSPPRATAGGSIVDAQYRLELLCWWDIEQIAALERTLFPADSPWSPEMFWSELAAGHHYVVVKDPTGGDAVIGYAGLAVHGDDDPDDEAEVQTIGVEPQFQGRGLGARLLDDLLVAAGRRRVLLEVRTDNGPARKLYGSRGFEVIGVRRGYYQPSNADAWVMQRTGS